MTPLACVPGAIAPDSRDEHFALIARLFRELAQERSPLADGYRYRFDSSAFEDVARFIVNERRCCPFLSFVLTADPDGGPTWLQVTGPEGSKAFLDAEFR